MKEPPFLPPDNTLESQSLRQALSQLDLDIIQELEQFRHWQQEQRAEAVIADLQDMGIRSAKMQGNPAASRSTQPTLQPNSVSRQLSSMPYTKRSGQSPHLPLQDVVEDLELEEGHRHAWIFSPLSILLLWLISCGGIGWGLWWLISPGDPRPIVIEDVLQEPFPTPEPTPELIAVDLINLPLIPVAPSDSTPVQDDDLETTAETPTASEQVALDPLGGETPADFSVDPLQGSINWLDALQSNTSRLSKLPSLKTNQEEEAEDASEATTPKPPIAATTATLEPDAVAAAEVEAESADSDQLTSSEVEETPDPDLATSPELASTPASATPTPAAMAVNPTTHPVRVNPSGSDPLGPDQGEGTYLVLMDYQGDGTLAQARQVANGAFVKDIDGQKYVQLASFQQLEYARYMAEELRKKGISTTITGF
jgi:hypothetical protein